MPKTYGARCIQIFVHTGGNWDGEQCPPLNERAVSVDIIINGIYVQPGPHWHLHTVFSPYRNLIKRLAHPKLTSPSKATSAFPQISPPPPKP